MAKVSRSLASQVVAITGGARGIGRATAVALLAQGARVAIGDIEVSLAQAAAEGPLVWLRHRQSCGQSAAVVTGIRAAMGEWIATIDGDGQNEFITTGHTPEGTPAILITDASGQIKQQIAPPKNSVNIALGLSNIARHVGKDPRF